MARGRRPRPAPPLIRWLALSERLGRDRDVDLEVDVCSSIEDAADGDERLARELRRWRRTIALTADLN